MNWSNLALWSAQIAILAAAGGLAPRLFRLRHPAARLVYWQALLLICLALPALQPWRHTVMAPADDDVSVTLGPAVPVEPGPRFGLADGALALLMGGMLWRAGWFGLGLWRLRRYRRRARVLDPLPPAVESVRRRLGLYPEMALSDEIAGPVTFGAGDPIVLFPANFAVLDASVQEALAYHELLHVQRRDWLFAAGEELVRAVFWFHPAVWWLLGQIQLAREQAVDRAVVQALAREQYVDALLTFSGARQQLDLMPAPLFLRRRHLTRRVAAIMKETDMSKRWLYASLAACFGGLVLMIWLAAATLPLRAAPQVAPDAPGVSVAGSGRLIHRAPVEYPADAREKGIEGTVVINAQVAADGAVADAAVASGPMELRKAALASVLQWHFLKDAAGTQQVSVTFKVPAPGEPTATPPAAAAPPTIMRADTPPVIKGLAFRGVEPAAVAELRPQLASVEGQVLNATVMKDVGVILQGFDRHLRAGAEPTEGGVNLLITAGPPVEPAVPQRIRVGGNVQQTMLVRQDRPVYPPEAKANGIEGLVRLTVVIGRDGKIQNITVVSGDPLLAPAAVEAVKTWEYRPTLLNGDPVEVVTTVDVNFQLAK